MRLFTVSLLVPLSLSACGAATPGAVDPSCLSDYRPLEQTVRSHRTRWNERNLTSYEFRYSRICFCPAETSGPFKVTVVDGVVKSAIYLGGGGRSNMVAGDPLPADQLNLILTIPQIFDKIEAAIAERACSIEVRFDLAAGYPSDATIDYDRRLADEELRISVSELKGLP